MTDETVAAHRLHPVEERGLCCQTGIDIGRLPRGEGGSLQTDLPDISRVGSSRPVDIVSEQLGCLRSLPLQDDAADFTDGRQPCRRRQALRAGLARRGQPTLVSELVERHDGVGIVGQRLQLFIDVLPDIGSQGVDGRQTPGSDLGSENHKSCQPGQFAAVGVEGGRAPAQDDAAHLAVVGDGREILWRLWGDVVGKYGRPDKT